MITCNIKQSQTVDHGKVTELMTLILNRLQAELVGPLEINAAQTVSAVPQCVNVL